MAHLIFVYGTLRKGFSNHHFLTNAKFIGKAKTKEKFALYISDFPRLIRDEKISHVIGEVYAIDDALLAVLDALEEHPYSYKREKIKVILEDGKEINAWVYFHLQKDGILVREGDLAVFKTP